MNENEVVAKAKIDVEPDVQVPINAKPEVIEVEIQVQDELGYTVLKEAYIKQHQEDDISKASIVLSISRVNVTILLCHYNWSVNKVHDEWFPNEEGVQ